MLSVALCQIALASPQAPDKYYLAKQRFEFPERGLIEGHSALSKNNRLDFIAPLGYVTTINEAGNQITSRSEDGRSTIDIRITTNDPAELQDLDQLKKSIPVRFPGSNIYNHKTISVDGRPAQMFDLEKFNSNGDRWNTRLVLTEFRGKVVEFTFSTAAQNFNSQLYFFSDFLNSFQAKERS